MHFIAYQIFLLFENSIFLLHKGKWNFQGYKLDFMESKENFPHFKISRLHPSATNWNWKLFSPRLYVAIKFREYGFTIGKARGETKKKTKLNFQLSHWPSSLYNIVALCAYGKIFSIFNEIKEGKKTERKNYDKHTRLHFVMCMRL